MTLSIIEFGNNILRRLAKEVPSQDIGNPEFKKLRREMIEIMESSKGTGIAAPQVGISSRFAIIKLWDENQSKSTEIITVYNPSITYYSQETSLDWEGCLSLPDIWGKVRRHSSIILDYFDENGKKVTRKLEGFNARVAQHEVDHLDGILFVDRMDSMKTLSTRKEAYKQMKKEDNISKKNK